VPADRAHKEYGATVHLRRAARRRELAAAEVKRCGAYPYPLHQSGFVTNRGSFAFHQEARARAAIPADRDVLITTHSRGVVPLPEGESVMVASLVPGEGKTFTSLNLALSMRLKRNVKGGGGFGTSWGWRLVNPSHP